MGVRNWRNDGVKVVRAAAQQLALASGQGRATAFDFAGTGGPNIWMGTVTLKPNGQTGAHHHGTHEVAVYVSNGRSRIRWGERLEFTTDVGPGDFVYFAPQVPPANREKYRQIAEFQSSDALRVAKKARRHGRFLTNSLNDKTGN